MRDIPISILLLDNSIKTHFERGVWTRARETAALILLGNQSRWAFARAKNADLILSVSDSRLDRLIDELRLFYTEVHKLKATWIPYESEEYKLPTGDAARAEIEITSVAPDGNLITKKQSPVDRFVEVYVDHVRFRQRAKGDGVDPIMPHEGKYIRIQVPGGNPGAVVLPVDRKTGDILLVTQYRHPQRQFLTEAPRGFGIVGLDEALVETAKREMDEETGAIPSLDAKGREEIFFLRNLFTDTGKLVEGPGYFIAFVDRKLQTSKLNRLEPTMEDPVWISLDRFYEAVYSQTPVKLADDEYQFALVPKWRKQLNSNTLMKQGVLEIRDAFTFTVAMLALPILKKHFPVKTPTIFSRTKSQPRPKSKRQKNLNIGS